MGRTPLPCNLKQQVECHISDIKSLRELKPMERGDTNWGIWVVTSFSALLRISACVASNSREFVLLN